MSQPKYFKKGEVPPPEYLERKNKRDDRSRLIRKKLFPERKGFSITTDVGGGFIYLPKVVRGCPDGKKPVVVLEISNLDPLDPDYVPRWICMCRDCFVRTESYRTPEAATNAWNHGIVTELSRLLHKPVNLSRDGISNLLNAIGKQAGDELVGYYRTERKLIKAKEDCAEKIKSARERLERAKEVFENRHYFDGLKRECMLIVLRAAEELTSCYRKIRTLRALYNGYKDDLKSVRGHIQDLEGFFKESFFFDGLSCGHIIKGLKERGELDADPWKPGRRAHKNEREKADNR